MCRKDSFCRGCHTNLNKTLEAQMAMQKILDEKQFVEGVVNLSILRQCPKMFSPDKKLLCEKYEVRIKTFALNEFLGRPVPNVLNLRNIMEDAAGGNFTKLDEILGFLNAKGEEIQILPFQQQLKMNDIMINILKAKGLDFDTMVQEIVKFKIESIKRTDKADRKDKKQRISKIKLSNQRKLGAVVKSVPAKQDSKEIADQQKEQNDSDRIKTAKDYEHYRKSKRPARI